MKRVQYDRYGGPNEMYLANYDLPPIGDTQVCVSVRAAAVNPFDWKLRRGEMKLVTGGRFPKVMGTDFAGVVEAVGRGVVDFRIGDEVFGSVDFRLSGAFAEVVQVDSRHLAKKPSQLSFEEAACLSIPAATAWVAILDQARARPGARIFINGCGGAVGALAVQLALSRGAQVGGACGPAARPSAEAAGVDPVFGYGETEAYAQDGKFDAVFDTLGTLGVGEGIAMLKPQGVFVDINPTPGRMLRGVLSRRYRLAFATMGMKHLSAIARLAGDGVLRPTVGVVTPFNDAVLAIADAETGANRKGKLVLTF